MNVDEKHKIARRAAFDAKLLTHLTNLAWRGAPTPSPIEVASALSVELRTAEKALLRICNADLIEIEHHDAETRYVVLSDDVATNWTELNANNGRGRRRGHDVPTTIRACMCCRNGFASEGIHNRLCNECKRSDAFGGFDPGESGGGSRGGAMMPGHRG